MSQGLLEISNTAAAFLLSAIELVGAFSRLTSGQYTPDFYAYQLERAPNNSSTRFIPFLDLILSISLWNSQTRKWSALSSTLFSLLGVLPRLSEGKEITWDATLVALAAFAAFSSFMRRT